MVSLLLARGHAMTGVVGVGSVFLFGLLMAGRFFAELTTTNFALLIVAPLLCWLIALPSVRQLKVPARFIVALLVCLVPTAAAVGLAYRSFAAATSETSAYGAEGSASDAPSFGAASSNASELSPTARPSSASSAHISSAPRDPATDDPTSPAGPEKPRSAPTDPSDESKK